MRGLSVLTVEDEALIALDVEAALTDAGWDVCGVSASQSEALRLGEATKPAYAVVDMRLPAGDGRVMARELSQRFVTTVLMATAHCEDKADLAGTGALGCPPKPLPGQRRVRRLGGRPEDPRRRSPRKTA
jgi:DNA-binding response OmpR family regulator